MQLDKKMVIKIMLLNAVFALSLFNLKAAEASKKEYFSIAFGLTYGRFEIGKSYLFLTSNSVDKLNQSDWMVRGEIEHDNNGNSIFKRISVVPIFSTSSTINLFENFTTAELAKIFQFGRDKSGKLWISKINLNNRFFQGFFQDIRALTASFKPRSRYNLSREEFILSLSLLSDEPFDFNLRNLGPHLQKSFTVVRKIDVKLGQLIKLSPNRGNFEYDDMPQIGDRGKAMIAFVQTGDQ